MPELRTLAIEAHRPARLQLVLRPAGFGPAVACWANSGHQDYLATVEDPRRKLRYVATLLAKELVFKRHQRPESSDMLEQMVEVLSWAERRMPR